MAPGLHGEASCLCLRAASLGVGHPSTHRLIRLTGLHCVLCGRYLKLEQLDVLEGLGVSNVDTLSGDLGPLYDAILPVR